MTQQSGRKRNILRRIGIIGPPLAALSVLDKLDVLITFNTYVEKFLGKWQVLIAFFWNSALNIFGIDNITRVDAVFFTFFLMLFLSFLSSYSMRGNDTHSSQGIFGYSAAIIGVILIAIIFTIADINTYHQYPADYLNSTQYEIYYLYIDIIQTRNIPASAYTEYISFIIDAGFYSLCSLFIWIMALILAKIIGVRIHIWKLSRRLYFVVGLVGAVLIVNQVLLWLTPYLETASAQ